MPHELRSHKSWREKLEKQDHSKIVDIPPQMAKRLGSGTVLIPKPLDVDALIRKTKKGQVVTVSEIRSRLARDNRVDTTCPLTTGISEAAEEDLRHGRKRVTPYWRVIRDDGSLNQRFPGGVKAQSQRLRAEGHSLATSTRKRPPKVRDF